MLQAIDAGLGRDMKHLVGVELTRYLEDEERLDKWDDGAYAASERRVLMTQWVGRAWKEFLPMCSSGNLHSCRS